MYCAIARATFRAHSIRGKRIPYCQSSILPKYPLRYYPWHSEQTFRALSTETSSVSEGTGSRPKRGEYPFITPADVSALRSMLSTPSSLLSTIQGEGPQEQTVSEEELAPFNEDWMGKYKGQTKVVIKPRSVEEVGAIVKYCSDHDLPIVPQGGNTGLVGGSVPVFDEIVINLSNMNKIRHFDQVSGILTCDAGCVLEVLDNELAEKGYMMPLDLGAKGSCQIGGNVATNAGGLRVIRYGSLRGTVLGLEVVLPDGRVLDALNTLRKDNTGFDLKQIFIGSEGSVGIITGVSVLAAPKLMAKNVAVFAVPSYDAVQKTFAKTRSHVGEILSAFEFFDREGHEIQQSHSPSSRKILEGGKDSPFYVLVETTGSNKEHDDEKLSNLLEDLLESETITDGVLAQDTTQFASIWRLREGITEALGKTGKVFKYDVSLPASSMYDLVEAIRVRLHDAGLYKGKVGDDMVKAVTGFGHFGDGNLHLNVVAKSYATEVQRVLEPFVYQFVSQYRGSISAEHGLGLQKAPYIGYSQKPLNVELMQTLKGILDPKNIFNPYKFVKA